MSMIISNTATTLSKQTDAYTIKNPSKVTNEFTITDEFKAAEALRLKSQETINELKEFLKDYDMTSISSEDLRRVGGKLYYNNFIDRDAFYLFILGDGANDVHGKPTKTDVKFNAIALFNERLEDHIAYFKSDRYSKPEHVAYILGGMRGANQAINALAYLSNATISTLSIDEHA